MQNRVPGHLVRNRGDHPAVDYAVTIVEFWAEWYRACHSVFVPTRYRDRQAVLKYHAVLAPFAYNAGSTFSWGFPDPAPSYLQVKKDIKLVIRFTSYWILYGALSLTVISVFVSAVKGLSLKGR
jgi:hypothetical protein